MLSHRLTPLKKYLERSGLHELHADRFGEIFLIGADGERKRVVTPELDQDYWWALARAIANDQNVKGLEARPYLRAGIMTKAAPVRFTLSLGETIRSGIIAVGRRITPGKYTIDDFGLDDDTKRLFKRAVAERWNIMICGAMDSGKTSFLNALTKLVPRTDRIATIQDVPELSIEGNFESYTEFLINTLEQTHKVTSADILDVITRGSYRRVWLGEANISNTWMLLRALNFGLGGFIGTVHSDSARFGLDALAINCVFAQYDEAGARTYFAKKFQIFVHIARENGIPRLQEVWMPETAHAEDL